ncbi:MAG: hypothetical protein QG673_1612 [Pseudomonadota bacterium]|nr:hypothetical protein [Pseudomonadota bacterium]
MNQSIENIFNINEETRLKPEIVDFIYENGVENLAAINESMKNITERGVFLLSFLMVVMGFVIEHIISHIVEKEFNFLVVYGGIFLVVYYGCISWSIILHLKPSYGHTPRVEPNHFFIKPGLETFELWDLKYIRIIELQNAIEKNRKRMQSMYEKFENALAYTFIVPALFKQVRKFICPCCA